MVLKIKKHFKKRNNHTIRYYTWKNTFSFEMAINNVKTVFY